MSSSTLDFIKFRTLIWSFSLYGVILSSSVGDSVCTKSLFHDVEGCGVSSIEYPPTKDPLPMRVEKLPPIFFQYFFKKIFADSKYTKGFSRIPKLIDLDVFNVPLT